MSGWSICLAKSARFSVPLRSATGIVAVLFFLACFPSTVLGQEPAAKTPIDKLKPKESDYYQIVTLPIPDGVVLEASGITMTSSGRLAVASRRGEIYLVDKPLSENPADCVFHRYASGLHEVLGLAERDGWLYATQRCELTRIKDLNNDLSADRFETVSDGWEISGDYHEYAFGTPFDKDGNIWIVLCLTGSFSSNVKYRGWCVRVNADGKLTPTCSGIRSPGGIGFNCDGEVFYTDNQGPWNGSCGLKHLTPGSFQGHPDGNRWFSEPEVKAVLGESPVAPKSGSRIMAEVERVKELTPTAIFFPYGKMGQSAAGIACDSTGGKFGPFAGQLFVTDQSASTVMRCYLEKVNGKFQGACFPFRAGFASGALSLHMTKEGSLFVGGTNRGWGSRGGKPFSLERLAWTGETPFEIHQMRARPDGFELTFTEEIDPATAGDVKSYSLSTYTYIYQSAYGSPTVDPTTPKILKAVVGADKKSVRLEVDKLQIGHVHELKAAGVKSAGGAPLVHSDAYYTLNYIPSP